MTWTLALHHDCIKSCEILLYITDARYHNAQEFTPIISRAPVISRKNMLWMLALKSVFSRVILGIRSLLLYHACYVRNVLLEHCVTFTWTSWPLCVTGMIPHPLCITPVISHTWLLQDNNLQLHRSVRSRKFSWFHRVAPCPVCDAFFSNWIKCIPIWPNLVYSDLIHSSYFLYIYLSLLGNNITSMRTICIRIRFLL